MYDQKRLNVNDKRRSNPFTWRGQFTPELIDYFLDTHYEKGTLVADPFLGSGTVLLESIRRNLDTVGCEINPSAYAMSKFFELASCSYSERSNLYQRIISKVSLPKELVLKPIFDANEKDYRKAYSSFIKFAQHVIDSHSNKQELIFMLNILFKMEALKKMNVEQAWEKSFKEISNFLYSLPETSAQISAFLTDARLLDKYLPRKAHIIITSPPYINVFNYHQNHRIIMELLKYDILEVARCEFGSNRKNRGNRFLTVIQYCLDMAQAISSMRRSISNNGTIIMVVGRESNVMKTPFYNGDIVCDLALESGIFSLKHRTERMFQNKFGANIFEDILVFNPLNFQDNTIGIARLVAKKHLEKAVLAVNNDTKKDLYNAIDTLYDVAPSPIYQSIEKEKEN